jgi:ATPase related to the helicase subunit of the Holliday junction resolvase
VAEEAKMSGTVVLLLDEIHRLDKTKQDFLLPLLESGSIILIGATTENPYINISPAIRSRVQIFELHPLTSDDLKKAVRRALEDDKNGLGKYDVQLDENALNLLVNSTNGDLRSILNGLELSVLSTESDENGQIHIDLQSIEESIQRKAISADKNGDSHYDVISAFQKSIRGSDPNAALLYLARLLEAGELTSAIRRLLVCAYEDIGLANPQACARAVQAAQVAQMVGLPEARIPLADAVIDLCLCPKSNSGITAIDSALEDVRNGVANSIPDDLKDAHYSGAKKLGHGIDYKYPHNYPNSWVEQQYLPNNLVNKKYYQPKNTGKYEQALNLRMQQIQEWKKNSKRG